MKKLYMGLVVSCALASPAVHAAITQVIMEAENVSGGDVKKPCVTSSVALECTQDQASNGAYVARSSDGIYLWWLADTSSLTPGSYSVYVRARVSANFSADRNFGWEMYYGTQKIAEKNVLVKNRVFEWIRIDSIDLNSVGDKLRMSDWSMPGIDIDKVAIVKDITVEAENVAAGTVTFDSAALGGKAVARSAPGTYVVWNSPDTDRQIGDYDVYARVASANGAGHNLGLSVKINGTEVGYTNTAVSSLAYQWTKLNTFTDNGGGPAVAISDYSAEGLKIDKLRIARKTPYEKMSAAQNIFAAGPGALGTREQILFRGKTGDLPVFIDPGRVSFVPIDDNTVYAYFRQQFPPTPGKMDHYQIYMAVSRDGGVTFDVQPNALVTSVAPDLKASGAATYLTNAYDPQVTRRADGFYMVFEGTGKGCNYGAMVTKSTDGIAGWQAPKVLVCATDTLGAQGSASVPNFYVNRADGTQYIQWASMDYVAHDTQHYQSTISSTDPKNITTWNELRIDTASQMTEYLIPKSTSSWDARNTSAANIRYEDGYYYMFYDGSTEYDCKGQWALGVMRSDKPGQLASWKRSARNPFILGDKADSCWISYPDVVTIKGKTYVYYQNPFVHRLVQNGIEGSDPARTTFRHEIIMNNQ
jgi:hypothetical protein